MTTSIPHLFRCPISLDLFSDPVTLSTGQTYDRPSIEKWLAGGNLTCPVTMQRLLDPTLVPNHTLRQLIDQWLLSGTIDVVQVQSRPITNRNESSLATLKRCLLVKQTTTTTTFTLEDSSSSSSSSSSTKMEILKKIRILSVESDTGRQCLIQLGFFPLLLDLILQSPQILNPTAIEIALDCLLNLSPLSHLNSLRILTETPKLSALISLLQKNPKLTPSLCYLLEAATSARDICVAIGRETAIYKTLIPLLSSSHSSESDAAIRALAGLCSSDSNLPAAISEGAVDGIVNYLAAAAPGRRGAAAAAVAVGRIVRTEAGRRAVGRNPKAVEVLVRCVFRVSAKDDGCSEHAVAALLKVCGEGDEARVTAVEAGALSQLLMLLQSQCGAKAKVRARALLKVLSSVEVSAWGER